MRFDPERLTDHVDMLYRAAWALCRSRHEAEDLVQEMFANFLKRPRSIRPGSERVYLLRALRNTHASRLRATTRAPVTRELFEDDATARDESDIDARAIMEAIARPGAVPGRGGRRRHRGPLLP